MIFTPRKVTSRTPDCARRTRSMRDRKNPETGINQWKYTIKLIYTCVTAQFNRAVGLPSFSPKPVVGVSNWNKPNGRIDSDELVGSGKFVNQNTLVASYYSRTVRLTESPKF